VREALQDIDIVIHAAAHKHVPICEQNPLSAIENNVLGAYVLLGEAALAGVKQFILISSDKAVKPASVMGATKRIAELIVRDIPDADSAMRRTVVRFGNVLDSAGSVLPLWREQIAKGGPLTLTDERCTRYFMSIPEAVDLVLNTTALNSSGTFVLDMGSPRKMIDLALDLLEKAHENRFRTREECRDGIRFIGLRPGEKLTEELNYGGELLPTKLDRVRRVRESIDHVLGWGALKVLIDAVITRHTELALKTMWDLVA
jgi:FlaA1/EpsC-like NDP-sugar epimerase